MPGPASSPISSLTPSPETMPNAEPLIRLAEAGDAPAVASLIRALEVHYADPGSTPEAALAVVSRSLAEREGTRYAVAFAGGRAVGLACFAVLRPGLTLQGLIFVKELFVAEDARGQAVGEAMMRWLAAYGRAHGIGRIDLTTDGGNRRAQAFYERLGARRLDKAFYRFLLSDGGPGGL
ncbi:GNAT family N-acetyltransferase [Microvirga pudoricolor]|uniref:GNAT family N-acetyltransferase n=1 Tax=Microvirga pudoricolor TaxID=2778729 RepID=UPI00194E1B2A|nr:GNAT family N-acetyltransferase [Microvirga pudoricolor]MBM6593855.1 GNAT family N-acetyltransferase [Microvirga pudoricolor]